MRVAGRISWPFILATTSLAGLPWLVVRLKAGRVPEAQPYQFPTVELAALDKVIQERFAVIPDKDFGMGRVGPRHAYFDPETDAERAAISDLQAKRQEVVFFIVPRQNILEDKLHPRYKTFVQGPVYITPKQKVALRSSEIEYGSVRFHSRTPVTIDAPSDSALKQLGRKVFDEPNSANGANVRLEKWSAVAKPILASSESCVNCHNQRESWKKQRGFFDSPYETLKVGDILGVAIYCYRPQVPSTKRLVEDSDLRNLDLKIVPEHLKPRVRPKTNLELWPPTYDPLTKKD